MRRLCPAGLHAWPDNARKDRGITVCIECARDTEQLVAVQQSQPSLADLYKKGKAAGLLSAATDYR